MGLYSRDLFNVTDCDFSSLILSEEQKALVQGVVDGSAFTNPIEAGMQEAQGAIDQTLAGINTSLGEIIGLDEDGNQQTTFGFLADNLSNLRGGIDAYRVHSDRLSGVSLSKTFGEDSPYGFGGIAGEYPGLAGLQQVAQTYNSLKETFRDPTQAAKDNYSPIFNSLFGPGNDLMRSMTSLVNGDVGNFLSNYPTGSGPEAIQEVTRLGTEILELQSDVTNLINDDNLQYEFALDFIAKHTVGLSVLQMLDDPCFGQKLLQQIGSPSFKETAGI